MALRSLDFSGQRKLLLITGLVIALILVIWVITIRSGRQILRDGRNDRSPKPYACVFAPMHDDVPLG
jgi:hypothetical protein